MSSHCHGGTARFALRTKKEKQLREAAVSSYRCRPQRGRQLDRTEQQYATSQSSSVVADHSTSDLAVVELACECGVTIDVICGIL